MTKREIEEIKKEIDRLENIQADSILDKKTKYAVQNHKKIIKLRRMLKDVE